MIWVLFLIVSTVAARPGDLHLLDNKVYPDARCLDGSSGAFYFKPASSQTNSTKWVISLEGGGECVTKESCLARANTTLGSSKDYKPQEDLLFFHYDADWNPFRTHNQVYIKYCSGDLHLGSHVLEWGRFSGHDIISGVLATLVADHHLSDATLVLWTGVSAGGIGSTAWVDRVSTMLPSAAVYGAPIAGFYFSNNWTYAGTSPAPVTFIPWDYNHFEEYYHLWGASVPPACAASDQHKHAPWQCIVATASFSTIKSPMLFIEAQTDAVVMPLHNGLPSVWRTQSPECVNTVKGCPVDIVTYMTSWKDHMRAAITQVIDSPKSGVFHPACLTHGGFTHTAPTIDGLSYLYATAAFVLNGGGPPKLYDDCGVMCNPTCNAP